MGAKTLLQSAIQTTFGIIFLAIMTSAPFFYYKINNQQPGMASTIGVTLGSVLICALIGTVIPVYVAKINTGLDWEGVIDNMVREYKRRTYNPQHAMTQKTARP